MDDLVLNSGPSPEEIAKFKDVNGNWKYTVTLKNKSDLAGFYKDMEHPTSGLAAIPDRPVDLADRRPVSNNTDYWLNHDEAEQLRNDSRVAAVELPPHLRYVDMYVVGAQDPGNLTFDRSATVGSAHVNWGLWRSTQTANPTGWGVGGTTTSVSAPLRISPSGANVDVVIVDGGNYRGDQGTEPNAAHPEYAVNYDGTGGSRMTQSYNWFQFDGAIGRTGNPQTTYVGVANTSDVTSNQGHCWHTAGTVAGNRQGWARDANIYNLDFSYGALANANGTITFSAAYISSYLFNYIEAFHNSKKVGGVPVRPTVVNNSWGSGMSPLSWEQNVHTVNFRGTVLAGSPNLKYGYYGIVSPNGWFGDINAKLVSRGTLSNVGFSIITGATAADTQLPDITYTRVGAPAGGTTVTFSGTAGVASANITLPFNITYCNTSYNSISVQYEWWLGFGAFTRPASTEYYHTNLNSISRWNPGGIAKLGFGVFSATGTNASGASVPIKSIVTSVSHGIVDNTAGARKYLVRVVGYVGDITVASITPNMAVEFTFYEATPNKIDMNIEALSAYTRGNIPGTTTPRNGHSISMLHEWGFTPGGRLPARTAAVDADLQQAITSGVISVGAAGNENWKIAASGDADYNNICQYYDSAGGTVTLNYNRPGTPAANDLTVPNIIVGALSANSPEYKAYFSNKGTGVDIWAAGENIMSCTPSGVAAAATDPRNTSYKLTKMNGTSMACPQITGMIAAYAETNASLTQAAAKSWLIGNGKTGLNTTAGGFGDFFDTNGAPNRIAYYPIVTRPKVSVSVSPASVTEGGSPLTFTITRDTVTATSLTVNYTLSGTATVNTDYTVSPNVNSATIPASQASVTVVVTPTLDNLVEAAETVILTLSSSTSYDFGATTSATGSITDPATPTVTLSVSPASVLENSGTAMVYTFTRSATSTAALTVNFTVAGTATPGTDYTNTIIGTTTTGTKTITIPANATTATLSIAPTGDTTVELDETVILTLAAGTGYAIGTTAGVTCTITNDDTATTPTVTLTVSPASVLENSGTAIVYTFTRSASSATALPVNFTVGGTATPGTDYTNTIIGTTTTGTKTISIPANATSVTLSIAPTGDTAVEPDETIILTLATGTGYTIGTTTGVTSTITNDDSATPSITLAVSPVSVLENSGTAMVYTFTRSVVTATALTVNFTVAGTATPGTDYTNTIIGTTATGTKTITIPANTASATLSIAPTGDTTIEPDETVILTLATGTGYTIGTTAGVTCTILNDDAATPTVTLSVSPTSVLENSGTAMVYTFTRSAVATTALTVNFTVAGTATPGTDYTNTIIGTTATGTKTISIPANATTATLSIVPTGDTTVEPDETVILTLATGTGYTVGTTAGVTCTILNDDSTTPTVTLTVSPTSVLENSGTAIVYTFTRSATATTSLPVNFTVGGTATPGTDYTNTIIGTTATGTKTVTIPANATSVTLSIAPTGDTAVEPDETIILTLAAGTGYTVGTTTGVTSTITNDDGTTPTVTLSVSPTSVLENSGTAMVYTFTRSAVAATALTVNFTVSGTATPGTDYTGITSAGAKTISIPANATTATLSVTPVGDTTAEPDETIILTLNTGTGYTVGTTAGVTATITNDDTALPNITLAVSPTSVLENSGTAMVYTFTRSIVTATALPVNFTVGGTATPGTDYTNAIIGTTATGTKTITIPANAASVTLAVTPVGDTVIEANETIILTLATGTGYNRSTTTGVTCTITNDDTPAITLAVAPTSVAETSTTGLVYTFTRSVVAATALTVNFNVSGTATPGTDYTNTTIGTTTGAKTISIPANAASVTLTVLPKTDAIVESTETVILTLATGTGYTITTTAGVTGSITNV